MTNDEPKITFRATQKLKDKIAADAKKKDRSEGYVIREILEKHYKIKKP